MTGTGALRLAMLISGSGTTAEQVLLSIKSGRLTGIQPVAVIASHRQAFGLARAYDSGLSGSGLSVCDPEAFDSPDQFGEALLEQLRRRGVDIIGQYGWMPKTPSQVIAAYPKMMINQHPGPLDPGRPDFGGKKMYGKRVHAARMAFAGLTGPCNHWTEATAQFVAHEFDKGQVLKREWVPIKETDTVDDLQERTLRAEHNVQIATLQDFADGKVRTIHRIRPLVHDSQLDRLNLAKDWAVKQYPKG